MFVHCSLVFSENDPEMAIAFNKAADGKIAADALAEPVARKPFSRYSLTNTAGD